MIIKNRGLFAAVVVAVGILAAAALLAILPGGLEFRVTPVKGGTPLAVLPLAPGERFTVHYYHSVENAPIWETHSVDADGRIYIEEERYLKFGAGMGKMPGVGRMEMRGPYEVITDMHMPVGDFILRIGSPGVDHTLIWRGRQRDLSAEAPHVAVQFSARPVSRLYALWQRVFPHPSAAKMLPE
ncbi:MAG: DUF1850 domain-containing protein [Pseudomonadota bacterium]